MTKKTAASAACSQVPHVDEVSLLLQRLYPVIILNTISTGMLWPALPAIAMKQMKDDVPAVATFFGRINAASAILGAFSNPMLGTFSDTYGRRIILLQSLVVATICHALVALKPQPPTIFATKIIFAAFNVTKAMGYSMLVDTMDVIKIGRSARLKAFGRIGMAMGIGFSLGPIIGGFIGARSPTTAVAVAAALTACTLVLAYFTVPETHLHRNSSAQEPRCLNLCAACGQATMLTTPERIIFAFPFLLAIVAAGPYAIWYVYAKVRYGWGSLENGVFLAGYGIMTVLAQGIILPRLTPAVLSEQAVVFVGFLSNSVVFALYGLLNRSDNLIVFALLPLCLCGALSDPVLRHVFTQLASMEEQGALQGAISALTTLGNACGPLIAARLLSYGSNIQCMWSARVIGGCKNLIGLPFFFSSMLFLVSSLFSQWAFVSNRSGPYSREREREGRIDVEEHENLLRLDEEYNSDRTNDT